MPIYEYQCPKCGIFEVTQRIVDNALKRCPTCKSKVERIISNTSFILKGSGWYVTDYGRAGKPVKTESTATGDSSASSQTSTNGGSSKDSSKSPESSSKAESSPKTTSDKSTATKSAD